MSSRDYDPLVLAALPSNETMKDYIARKNAGFGSRFSHRELENLKMRIVTQVLPHAIEGFDVRQLSFDKWMELWGQLSNYSFLLEVCLKLNWAITFNSNPISGAVSAQVHKVYEGGATNIGWYQHHYDREKDPCPPPEGEEDIHLRTLITAILRAANTEQFAIVAVGDMGESDGERRGAGDTEGSSEI